MPLAATPTCIWLSAEDNTSVSIIGVAILQIIQVHLVAWLATTYTLLHPVHQWSHCFLLQVKYIAPIVVGCQTYFLKNGCLYGAILKRIDIIGLNKIITKHTSLVKMNAVV